ncbi:hypothetical protein BU16DRAFT_300347 [Lophium mytilinum]|uniref:Uncharacterized protein n=1 Tax=Lophium mytilinum TaxID=390894 RepID=A0A6A6R243_9PEZI|nr:hypothetical protein BU16DRAFT_300347 [Lophium mytilinum]
MLRGPLRTLLPLSCSSAMDGLRDNGRDTHPSGRYDAGDRAKATGRAIPTCSSGRWYALSGPRDLGAILPNNWLRPGLLSNTSAVRRRKPRVVLCTAVGTPNRVPPETPQQSALSTVRCPGSQSPCKARPPRWSIQPADAEERLDRPKQPSSTPRPHPSTLLSPALSSACQFDLPDLCSRRPRDSHPLLCSRLDCRVLCSPASPVRPGSLLLCNPQRHSKPAACCCSQFFEPIGALESFAVRAVAC